MRKINNNYLGDFYIEELENREEKDRVKLYDSNYNYLDYLPLERYDNTDPTFGEQYDGYVEMLESFKTVPDLINWLVCDCDCSSSEVLTTLEGRYGIYNHCGDMLLVKW
jgi:hypothetical protein